jgi:hypothetical protein
MSAPQNHCFRVSVFEVFSKRAEFLRKVAPIFAVVEMRDHIASLEKIASNSRVSAKVTFCGRSGIGL